MQGGHQHTVSDTEVHGAEDALCRSDPFFRSDDGHELDTS